MTDMTPQATRKASASSPIRPAKEKLVLVGNGMAGVRALEELLKIDPDLYDVSVFGAEPYGNYNRILLSPVLSGEKSIDDIILNDDAWYREHGIRLHKGRTVTRIDRKSRKVVAMDGTLEPYDRLLLATGSSPIILPVAGEGTVDQTRVPGAQLF